MKTSASNIRGRSFIFLTTAALLAVLLAWYPLYRAQHASGMFAPSGLFLIFGLPIHAFITWTALRGFLMLLMPCIRDGRVKNEWLLLTLGGVLALAGVSPLLIFAKMMGAG